MHKIKNAIILFSLTLFVYNIQINSRIVTKSKSSAIILKSGTSLTNKNNVNNFKGKIVKESNSNIKGSNIEFNNGSIEENKNKVKLTGILNVATLNKITLDGGKTFQGKNNKIAYSIFVSGTDNVIEGEFISNKDITLQDINTTLTVNISNAITSNIKLNNGKLKLKGNLKFADSKKIVGPGTITLDGYKLELGAQDLIFDKPIHFKNAKAIALASRLDVKETLTFEETNIISGNNNIMSIEGLGAIEIKPNSSLLLKKIIIHGSKDAFHLIADNSKITFQNVTWYLDDNYSFTHGSFEIVDKLELCGSYTFVYQSNQTSTIDKYSTLLLDSNITFSYDPLTPQNNLLYFEDNSSVLKLNSATLHSTVTGLQLTKGTLVVKGNSYLSCETITTTWGTDYGKILFENGITFGNNSAAQDFTCKFLNGSKLELTQGSLLYKNTESTSWDMANNSSVLQIDAGSKLKLYQTLNSGYGKIKLEGGCQVSNVSEKYLLGYVDIEGAITNSEL